MASMITGVLDRRVTGSLTFTTRQRDDPADFVRTRGVVLRAHAGLALPLDGIPVDPATPGPADAPVASGKVAVLHDDGSLLVRVHQRSESGADVRTVACSNATAAASAAYAGDRPLSFALALPGGQTVAVDTHARLVAPGEVAVVQTWHDVRADVHETGIVDGRRVARCCGPLNDYLLVTGRPDDAADALTLDDARALWARFGFLDTPLRARLAFVRGNAPRPRAAFFTCGGREHPSAPLTGLAVLAIARHRLDWPELRGLDAVETGIGPIGLPGATVARDGATTFEFPSVVVRLDHP